jgi:hypothetical protein
VSPRRWSRRAEFIWIVLLVLVVSAVGGLAVRGAGQPPPGNTAEVRSLAGPPTYDRPSFGDWRDEDGDCQDTRNEVLLRDLTNVLLDERGCVVLRGMLRDPYTGELVEFVRGRSTSSLVQIDHVLPPKAAWDGGAHAWPTEVKRAFYNDLDNLVASAGRVNASKGALLPSAWTERVTTGAGCAYLATVLQVATSYDVDLPPAEDAYLASAINQCPTPLTTR